MREYKEIGYQYGRLRLPKTAKVLGSTAIEYVTGYPDNSVTLVDFRDSQHALQDKALVLPGDEQIVFTRVGKRADQGGVPIMTFHGNPGSRKGPLIKPGAAYRQSLDVISPDRWGYGLTSRRKGASLAEFAIGAVVILDALGIEKSCVIGRSGGGPVALACAALYPERFVNVGLLASIGPKHLMGNEEWVEGASADNKLKFRTARRLEDIEAVVEQHARDTEEDPFALLEHLEEEGLIQYSDKAALTWQGCLVARTHREGLRGLGWADDMVALEAGDWNFDPRSIEQPVFGWHGTNDKCVPVGHAEWYRDNLPTSMVMLEPGKSHFNAVEMWPVVAAQQKKHFRSQGYYIDQDTSCETVLVDNQNATILQ